jgi:hypothetical protein
MRAIRMSTRRIAHPSFIIAALAASALLLTMAMPVAAAPTQAPAGGSDPALADHVTTCNVTFDAEGNVLLNGTALGVVEAALLNALLAGDASLAAAFEAAADADADTCINLAIDVPSIDINADIEACGDVVFTAETVTVGGVEISADLLDAELINLLELAAVGGVDACVFITITDNEVVVDAVAQLCVDATLSDSGVISVVIGSDEFFLDGTIVDVSGLLDVGVTARVNLLVVATLDVAGESVELSITVTACAAAATPTPTPTQLAAGAGATPTPVPLLPNTSVGSVDPGTLVVATLMIVSLASMAVVAMRGVRRS